MKAKLKLLASFSSIVFASWTLQASTYFLQSQGDAPYPFDPAPTASLTQIGPDQYVVNDTGSFGSLAAMDDPDPTGGGDTNPPPPAPPPPLVRNYAKFGAQVFSMLDTNSLANDGDTDDSNLYYACALMTGNTNGTAWLTIAKYGPDAVIIRADNFGPSDTLADFALLVCDKVNTPTWKAIDFGGASDAQDGWLVQGTVAWWQLSSTMFFLVTNLNTAYSEFFQVIPYSGAQVAITGTNQPGDTVSNVITLTTQILDLSGTTNEVFAVDVDGEDTRYSLSNDLITLDTKYNENNFHSINLNVQNMANVWAANADDAPADAKLNYIAQTSMGLYFQNDTYLIDDGSYASTVIGTNYFLVNISEPQNCAAIITDPSNGNVVFAATNYVDTAGTVAVPWNFTEGDGVTPYSNNTYVVNFIAFDPTGLVWTNPIPRNGVRRGTGCYITYETEDPSTQEGNYLDYYAGIYMDQTLQYLYSDIYDYSGLTEYGVGDIGAFRNYTGCASLVPGNHWADFLQPALSNSFSSFVDGNDYATYSDLTVGSAHGNGGYFGGGDPQHPYLSDKVPAQTLNSWVMAVAPTNWPMRKVAIWSCYGGDVLLNPHLPNTSSGQPLDLAGACGILSSSIQIKHFCSKNTGLVFKGLLPQAFGISHVTSYQAAEQLDEAWVCGPFDYPGGCYPTYSFTAAVGAIADEYVEITTQYADALAVGFYWLPYTVNFDDQITTNNLQGIETRWNEIP